MKIVWSSTAIASLQQIYDFISLQSPERAARVTNEIIDASENINPFPNKHQIEEILGFPYRYLVYGNYKVIFQVHTNEIRIYKVFDTRQDPQKMAKQ